MAKIGNKWWYSHSRKIVWQFKTKMQLPYNPAIALLSICPKEIKTLRKKKFVYECSQQSYLSKPQTGNNLDVLTRWMVNKLVRLYHGTPVSNKKKQQYGWQNYTHGEQIDSCERSRMRGRRCGCKRQHEESVVMEPFGILTVVADTHTYLWSNCVELNTDPRVCTHRGIRVKLEIQTRLWIGSTLISHCKIMLLFCKGYHWGKLGKEYMGFLCIIHYCMWIYN